MSVFSCDHKVNISLFCGVNKTSNLCEIMTQFNSDVRKQSYLVFVPFWPSIRKAKEFKFSHSELFHVLISAAQSSLKQTYDYFQVIFI